MKTKVTLNSVSFVGLGGHGRDIRHCPGPATWVVLAVPYGGTRDVPELRVVK